MAADDLGDVAQGHARTFQLVRDTFAALSTVTSGECPTGSSGRATAGEWRRE
ncbi:hypothetical protein [Streptomyces sp. IBSBF 3136]|uniref:hypothetical protein n=1 Tax=Streptomyces sp. IBSBF 3136 TaxID=2903524 RepID=UPI002FDBD0EE